MTRLALLATFFAAGISTMSDASAVVAVVSSLEGSSCDDDSSPSSSPLGKSSSPSSESWSRDSSSFQSSSSSSSSSAPPSLPLDWTRVKRRRTDGKECVDGYSSLFEAPSSETATTATTTTVAGLAIFCLHETGCRWFQGHFFPDVDDEAPFVGSKNNDEAKAARTVRPLGLLAVERDDVDDCLQCVDGGYRELDVTVFVPSNVEARGVDGRNGGRKRRAVTLRAVCTGGDMLRMRSRDDDPAPAPAGEKSSAGATAGSRGPRRRYGEKEGARTPPVSISSLAFDAERVLTGTTAGSDGGAGGASHYLGRYFAPLLRAAAKKRVDADAEADADAGDGDDDDGAGLLPDAAVVLGRMRLELSGGSSPSSRGGFLGLGLGGGGDGAGTGTGGTTTTTGPPGARAGEVRGGGDGGDGGDDDGDDDDDWW